ncbi:MAG: insulinase family protein [Chloroflexota bacterium]|nr:insulinase family protein [Chloroflexota bacterium]
MTDERRPAHAGHPGRSPHEEDPEKGFITDQDPLADVREPEPEVLSEDVGAATVVGDLPPGLAVLDQRPRPGKPRDYHFPRFERARLANGLTVVQAHLPDRPLLAVQLVLPGGAMVEGSDIAGVTALTARALTEGTRHRNAIEFVEAAERLGAELHADASWEALSCALEVPRSRFGAALALLAEMALEPAFPGDEVARLRGERLNDLLQARADPRRRAERVFPETIYSPDFPYSRPLGGIETTVRGLERETVAQRHASALRPDRATLAVAGDLTGLALLDLVEQSFGGWETSGGDVVEPEASPHPDGARVVLVDRPGAAQSELRVGHLGLPRSTPDFHVVSVLNALVGGTFGSRLNRLLREERGYTYGIHSAFELRRAAGPFVVRTGVETAVTVPALVETLDVLRGVREAEVEPQELETVRDYLVGVFPLRFEGSAQVAAALAGLAVFELPDDELDRYRPQIAAVQASDVLRAARRHIRPDEASIVVVGDATQVEQPLRAAELGPLTVIPAVAPVP